MSDPRTLAISEDDKSTWPTCQRCGHAIRRSAQVCDEAWKHSPCDLENGCVPEFPLFED